MPRKCPLARLSPFFFFLLSVFVASLCFSSPLPKNKRPSGAVLLAKRFYAWDEMSAKRSLIPPMPNEAVTKLGEITTEQSGEEKGHSRLAAWKRSLQQRPLILTRLFFAPSADRFEGIVFK